jgi:hypothetical protein
MKTSLQDDGSGSIRALDMLSVDCGVNKAISQFRFVNIQSSPFWDQMRKNYYEFSCVEANDDAKLVCRDVQTPPSADGGGGKRIDFLDRQNVACNNNEVRSITKHL